MKRSPVLVAGLILSGLFALFDLVPLPADDGAQPPAAVTVVGIVLALATLAGVVLAWRGSRAGAVVVIVTRLLAGLTAVPAFFVDGVPAEARVAAAVGVVLTLLCVALVAPALRSRA
ncbi:hypothetical protein [Microtetraspora niveoalba]|uniref:hypothetical protein n=1 Tax=Microtetraspora niveoalba TaxID=46175 RepID=UPI000830D683|nr:hypothetical protein [Microtetraspora niveoalba]